MQPVFASKFIRKLTVEQQQQVIKTGIVPVNDIFMPIWMRTSDIHLLFGGRGGGKSEAVFDRLLNNCLTDKYFRCYYGRKVFDTVRGSCFKTLVESIKKLGLEDQFLYSEADNSSMVITCKRNRNQFIPFGADKSDKLKSIKDPTHIVCEEFDQFLFLDFKELFPTLRTTRAVCEFFGMFNTHEVYSDHWLIKLFFTELYSGKEAVDTDMLPQLSINKIFVNYTDNYFIDQADYYNRLKMSAGGNMHLLQAIANGAWGVTENDNPWLHAFNYDKHVKKLPFLQSFPVYLNFDINNDPFTCLATQHSPIKGTKDSFIHFIKEFSGHIKAEDMCQQIKSTFPASIFYITGDRSGLNEDVGRNQTLYAIIQSMLGLSDKQMCLNTHNLEHADSRLLCNAMLEHYPNLFIDIGCKNFIADCQKATCDPDSARPSTLLKDRKGYKMDLFDGGRYYFQTYWNTWAKDTYFRLLKR